jgi:hypothetical protein
MNDKADFGSAVMGFILGAALMFAVTTLPGSFAKMGKDARGECEKSLPRDQWCVVTVLAVPSQEQGK